MQTKNKYIFRVSFPDGAIHEHVYNSWQSAYNRFHDSIAGYKQKPLSKVTLAVIRERDSKVLKLETISLCTP